MERTQPPWQHGGRQGGKGKSLVAELQVKN
jgi:hypothetical protein